jgi:hypothetical protein
MHGWLRDRFTTLFNLAALAVALFALAGCHHSGNSNCAPGERGCACGPLQTCQSGSSCSGGMCVPEGSSGLGVSDSQARGCEVLLSDGGGRIDRVDFGDNVTGRWLRQGDKVAAAFVANKDAPINGGITVTYAGNGNGSFNVVRSHCYGAKGEALPNAMVH